MNNILIIDDDDRILALLQQFLSNHGYSVMAANSVKNAQYLLQNNVFDLIVLDVMMPDITGLEFSAEIKKLQSIPVILLTALSKVQDRIKGLEAGADDYLSKPFEPKELLLRMQNLLDLYAKQKQVSQICQFGENTYNITTKEFKKGDQRIYLTSNEQKLLELFIIHKNKVLTRQDLLDHMGSLSLRSMDVQVVRLRAKIGDDFGQSKYLHTIRNIGYGFYI
jgi:two-component system phosphate regulon response regulator OmpR